uniref:Uncharacterized protein n=1 Tax=Medicago truncatula TaxID=3880 RepID=A2Q2B1_MEDTR|nr:hypothetical protein MtrDRAFT_AC149642g24v2 [Medicago truncatula]
MIRFFTTLSIKCQINDINFFWGGGEDSRNFFWIKWDNICLNKENRGLGVKRLWEFNMSLLEKWMRRVLEDKESLWNVVLRAKYREFGGRVLGRFGGVS